MKLEKFKNFMWGIAFGTCLSGVVHHRDYVIIPAIGMVLIGVIFVINLKDE
jgi:hypothetical protein